MGRRARRKVAAPADASPEETPSADRPEGGTQFLLEAPAEPGAVVELSDEEAHHARNVLRLDPGTVVAATDGRGGRYRLRLRRSGAARVGGEVLDRVLEPAPMPRLEVGLGVGRRERWLWAVEKLAELGVGRVVPLLSSAVQGRRALEREAARLGERGRTRAAAALKQSLGAHLTAVDDPLDLEGWMGETFDGVSLLLAMPAEGVPAAARVALGLLEGEPPAVRLAVGPEGGFSAAEDERLAGAGFVPGHLGARRLRFETAAVAGVCQLRALVEAGAAALPSSPLRG